MPAVVIDLGIGVLLLFITYAISCEGLWGAALMFFNILFSAMIAFNFYEALASLIAPNLPAAIAGYTDVVCLMVPFLVLLVVFRIITSSIAPSMVRFPTPLFHLGRVIFGFGAAMITVAMMIIAFEVAPVNKKVFGVIGFDYAPPFKQGLDHKWLGFFQYSTGVIFARYGSGVIDPFHEFGRSGSKLEKVRVFDPQGTWLIDHEKARPAGTGRVDEILESIESEGQPAAGAAGSPGGAPAPGAPGGAPGG